MRFIIHKDQFVSYKKYLIIFALNMQTLFLTATLLCIS